MKLRTSIAAAGAAVNHVRRQVDKPAVEARRSFRDVGGAGDVRALRHGGVQFARLEGAVAGGIQDGAEAVFTKQGVHAVAVFGVERIDVEADELPRLRRADADHLAGLAISEVG